MTDADFVAEQSVRMKKLLCRLLGHRNDISCMDKHWRYTHDKCSRCGAKLPIAYPHHKECARIVELKYYVQERTDD
jgi:hypothetical protein